MSALKIVKEDVEVRILREPILEKNTQNKIGKLTNIIRSIKMKINFKNKIKKATIAVFAVYFILMQSPLAFIYAVEAPSAPSAPAAPSAPGSTDDSSSGPGPSNDNTDSTDESIPTTENQEANGNQTTDESSDLINQTETNENPESETASEPTTSLAQTEDSSDTNGAGDGNVGDTSITSGDATNNAGIITTGNTNESLGVMDPASDSGSAGVSVTNSDNGSDLTNTGSVGLTNQDSTIQNNAAVIGNNLYQKTETGDNSASRNVGDSKVVTGDANTTGTVMTAVNTNIDGVMVNEFNITDDHMGDYVLDFSSACISGCYPGDVSAQNSGNGSESVNDAEIDSVVSSYTFQNNDATVQNDITLRSDS